MSCVNELFAAIERLIRGEYDLRGEKIITVSCDLAEMADAARDELEAVGHDFAELIIEGLYDLSEDCDAGTPEEGAEYTRRVSDLYNQAKTMM